MLNKRNDIRLVKKHLIKPSFYLTLYFIKFFFINLNDIRKII
jgi:hypothetical protein